MSVRFNYEFNIKVIRDKVPTLFFDMNNILTFTKQVYIKVFAFPIT